MLHPYKSRAMQYLKCSECHFVAVGEKFVKNIRLYEFGFGIEILELAVYGTQKGQEISKEEFEAAERQVQAMMFEANKLFSNAQTVAA